VQQDVRPPSPEEVAKLINAAWAADPDFGTLLWVAMTTGARRGELCALRWSHVRSQEGDLRRRVTPTLLDKEAPDGTIGRQQHHDG
jgi:integrase